MNPCGTSIDVFDQSKWIVLIGVFSLNVKGANLLRVTLQIWNSFFFYYFKNNLQAVD